MKRTRIIATSVCALGLFGMVSCGNKTAETTDSAAIDTVAAVDSAAESVDSVAITAEAARQDSIAKAEEAARKDSIAKAEEAAKPKADPTIDKNLSKLQKLISRIGQEGYESAYSEAHEVCSALWAKESKMTPEQKKKFTDLASRLGE